MSNQNKTSQDSPKKLDDFSTYDPTLGQETDIESFKTGTDVWWKKSRFGYGVRSVLSIHDNFIKLVSKDNIVLNLELSEVNKVICSEPLMFIYTNKGKYTISFTSYKTTLKSWSANAPIGMTKRLSMLAPPSFRWWRSEFRKKGVEVKEWGLTGGAEAHNKLAAKIAITLIILFILSLFALPLLAH